MSDSPLAPIEDVIAAIARGEIVVMVDDEDRENEGDFIMAAEFASAEKLAFIVRYSTGVVCAPLTDERCDELRLPLMVEQNTESQRTAFTDTVDLIEGTTTGISAADRAATLRGLSDPAALPLLMLVAGAWSLLVLPLVNALSRAQERAADRYALAATRNVDAFVTAMKRLSQQNLAEEYPSALVRWMFYSHPPIRERIEAARAFARGDHHAA